MTRFGPEGGLASRFVTSLAAIPGAGGAPVVWAGTRDAGVFRLSGRRVRTRRPRGGDEGDLLARRWCRRRCRDALDRDARLRTPEGPGGALGGPGPRVRPSRRPGLLLPRGKPPRRTRRRSGSGRTPARRSSRTGGSRRTAPKRGSPPRRSGLWPPIAKEAAAGPSGPASSVPGSTASMAGAGAPSTPARPSVPKTRRSSSPSTAERNRRSSGSGRRSRAWAGSPMDAGPLSASRRGSRATPSSLSFRRRGEGARTVWVGTRGGGLAEIVGDRVVAVYDRGSGLPNNNILSLAEVHRPDGRRELWVGTRGGVARRTLDDPRAAWSSSRSRPAHRCRTTTSSSSPRGATDASTSVRTAESRASRRPPAVRIPGRP